MNFFNKLGKKASETYQVTKEKASNLSEELKLRGKITECKEKISKNYCEIGEVVYNDIQAGNDSAKEDVMGKCEEITKYKEEIEKLENQILALKKVKKCVQCGASLNENDEFCSKCGASQPKQETTKVEVKQEPENVKEAEVVEVNNVENENKTEEVNGGDNN